MNLEELRRAESEWGGPPDQVLSFFSGAYKEGLYRAHLVVDKEGFIYPR